MISGSVRLVYMPSPEFVLVAKGRKTEDAVITYARSYKRDLPEFVRNNLEYYQRIWRINDPQFTERKKFFRTRDAYVSIRQWAFAEREKRSDLPWMKPDRLELIGGMIDPYECNDHPDDYAEFAGPREMSEEAGLIMVDADRKNLFEQVGLFFEDDRAIPITGNGQYEQWLYWVHDVMVNRNDEGNEMRDEHGFADPRHTGVKEETFPPFYLEVTRLSPINFHKKHAFFLRTALEWAIARGNEEYRPALEHMKGAGFEEIQLLTERPPMPEPPVELEEKLSAEELFLQEMADVRPLR